MRLLLGSGGFSTEELRSAWSGALSTHLAGVERVLFLPYALADHDAYVARMQDGHAGREVIGLHRVGDPVRAIEQAQAISVGGGNSFRLTRALHALGLLAPIRARVRGGVPYVGVSAGTNVACPTMMTTNDMPIVAPPSFEALGLVSFQINPHYFVGETWVEQGGGLRLHGGETRDERLHQYHEEQDLPVVGLSEGGWLRVDGSGTHLGGAYARVFRRGEAPIDVDPPADLGSLLGC